MAEPGGKEEQTKSGLYKKIEKPIDVENAKVKDLVDLDKVAKRSGIDFPYDGDSHTVTPERFVVVPKDGKKAIE